MMAPEIAKTTGGASDSDRPKRAIGSREIPVASQVAARLSVASEGQVGIRIYTSNNSILVSVEDLERLSYSFVEPKLHELLDKIRQTYGEYVGLDALRDMGIGVQYDAATNQIALEIH